MIVDRPKIEIDQRPYEEQSGITDQGEFRILHNPTFHQGILFCEIEGDAEKNQGKPNIGFELISLTQQKEDDAGKKALIKTYNQSLAINKAMLKQAFETAYHKNVPYVIYELKSLIILSPGEADVAINS